MKPKYNIPIILTLVVVMVGVYFYTFKNINIDQSTTTDNVRTYPTSSDSGVIFYPINSIKQNNFASGTYGTEGYVAKIYTCPSCPKGVMCKPCMGNNIVISNNNKILDGLYSLTENELIIFATNPEQFKLGKKYKFTIKMRDYKSTEEPINDVELVGYDLIE